MKKFKVPIIVFIILFLMYEEIIFAKVMFNTFNGIILKALLSLPLALIINLIINVFKEKGSKILLYLLTAFICFIFSAQIVYYHLYASIISFFSFTNGGQVLQFIGTILEVIKINLMNIIGIFIPFLLLIVLNAFEVLKYKRINLKSTCITIVFVALIQAGGVYAIFKTSNNNNIYSNMNLYYNVHAPLLTTNEMGLITTMRLDIQRLIFGFEEKNLIVASVEDVPIIEEEEIIEYNMRDIDFETLKANESNETISEMHEYFGLEEPTKKNEYTGMFEGKNLIVFVAEGFSSLAIREDVTPNLYKLYKDGFQFDNFYTPIFPVSTADGEYITDTSLIPKEGVWSLSKLTGNYMPYSYANAFEKLGYTSNAYHNHTASYYDRDLYIEAMGYNSYLATGTGLETRMNTKNWPNSDYEMLDVTTDDYVNNEKFMAYYMTVSGHLNYTTSGNNMASRNWELVKDLPYSAKARSYLATQIEFDKAIGELIANLETAGKLADTVIVISGDHYPYGLTLDEMNELSTYQRDDVFEKYHMPLLIWNSEMIEPIKIEKVGSSLDVLPTVLNLFGVEYDSRLLIGKDILSDVEPLVIFSNRSFITDKGRYNSVTKIFIPNEGVEIEEGYVEEINARIYGKYQMSKLILENNYYEKLKEFI